MIFINVDTGDLKDLIGLEKVVQKAYEGAVADLAHMTRAKLVELANEKLHSRREMYVGGLHVREEEGVQIISLDAKVRWIDDGQPAHNMLDDLLASPKAKTAKDGSRYLVIPFDHSPGQGPTKTTQGEQDLIGTVKKEMRSRGIPFGKIEKDAAGKAKTGKLHQFTIGDMPLKNRDEPGQGKGPLGQVRQGPTGIPFLENVVVYQHTNDKGKTKRQIMTFRVASSNHSKDPDQARWDHPGNAPMNLMEDAAKWALETWENEIVPGINAKILMDL